MFKDSHFNVSEYCFNLRDCSPIGSLLQRCLMKTLTYVVSPSDKFQRRIINIVLSAALVVLHPDEGSLLSSSRATTSKNDKIRK